MYTYEFTTLAGFAVAFRYWDQPYLFPVAVLFGASFMLGRFVLTLALIDIEPNHQSALIIAIVTLGVYVVFILGAFAATFLPQGGSPEQRLRTVHNVVTVLLLVGVIATVLAVDRAVGLKWGG